MSSLRQNLSINIFVENEIPICSPMRDVRASDQDEKSKRYRGIRSRL